ncbi:hypothetical protein [Nonomuraea sp. bgisy101]|uniref:hypothetical protein n=1 Tax=Nonomuraea sp. bgisy101 TaxID=3413784 RepID=UPI003D71F572
MRVLGWRRGIRPEADHFDEVGKIDLAFTLGGIEAVRDPEPVLADQMVDAGLTAAVKNDGHDLERGSPAARR